MFSTNEITNDKISILMNKNTHFIKIFVNLLLYVGCNLKTEAFRIVLFFYDLFSV